MPIKRIRLVVLPFIFMLLTYNCFGQKQDKTADGFNIQGIARDPLGNILPDKLLRITVTFSSGQGSTIPYFTEIHQVTTDEVGLFTAVAGAGQVVSGNFSNIPWGRRAIWIDYEFYDENGSILIGKQSHEVMAVPYAFHAISASTLLDSLPVTEKNKSIRWTTSGNSGIYPNANFVGTIDDRDLVIKTNNETNAILTNTGQFQVHGRVSGENKDSNNYTLVVDGSHQGIHITVNGARNGDTHFATFADDTGIQGRIEGQTESELRDSWQWQLQSSSFKVRIASLITQSIGLGLEAAGLFAGASAAAASFIFVYQAPFFTGAGIALSVFGAAVLGLDIAALTKEWTTWQSNTLNEVGVTYESGAGDYAEWLERAPLERDLTFGEIVGVKAGKISLNTSDADHLLVISKKPIVLGNLPPSGKTDQFEKTAFLGQVYARVVGPVSAGDYILPSGNHDGLGIAVNPAKMAIRDYSRIVGVAWESSTNHPIRLVKICVGQSTDQFAPAVEGIEKKLDKIKAYLGEKPAQQVVPPISRNLALSQTQAFIQNGRLSEHLLSIEAFDEYVDKNAENIKKLYAKIESSLIAKGVKLPDNSEAKKLFHDPIGQLKASRRKLEGSEFLKTLDTFILNK